MPRADTMCSMKIVSNPVPTATNPLGAKGAGEAGCVGALPAVMIAIMNALADCGVRELDMPATSERVWNAIRSAGHTGNGAWKIFLNENGGPIPAGPWERAPRLDPGRGPRRRRHDAPGDPRDGRRICRLVRPAFRPGLAGYRAHAARPRRQALAGRLPRAAQRRRSGAHGTLLPGDDIPERRQHHPYARLWSSHRARRPARGRPAQRLAAAGGQRRGLSRRDRKHRPVPDLRRGRGHDRLSPEGRPRRAGRAQDRQADRRGPGDPRQDRHAHQPRLCRGRLYRRPQRRRLRWSSRDVRRRRERPGRQRGLPQAVGARYQSLLGAPQQPFRRARRPDVAGRRADPLEPRLPDRTLGRAGGALVVLAPALLLARQGRIHAWSRPCLQPRDGFGLARSDGRVPGRSHHGRADGEELPDRHGARSGIHTRGLLRAEPRSPFGRQPGDAERHARA